MGHPAPVLAPFQAARQAAWKMWRHSVVLQLYLVTGSQQIGQTSFPTATRWVVKMRECLSEMLPASSKRWYWPPISTWHTHV